jgi:hypothetical protein
MIKTLRITTVIAAVLAAVFLVFLAVVGVKSDQQAEEFLNSPGVIENFTKARGTKAKDDGSQIPPLVEHAQAFGLYLNPPAIPKSTPKTKASTTTSPAVRPTQVLTKFELIGTSFHAMHPELSMALIDEPGKGLHWVRQSGQVGHLLIEQIKDGLVVVKDGERTFELVPERPKVRSLIRGKDQDANDTAPPSPSAVLRTAALDVPSRITTAPKPPQLTDERREMMEKLMSKMMAAQADSVSDKTGAQLSNEERMKKMEELLSQFQDTRISSEEAKKLDRLGKQLKTVEQDPNRPPPPPRRPTPTRRPQPTKK